MSGYRNKKSAGLGTWLKWMSAGLGVGMGAGEVQNKREKINGDSETWEARGVQARRVGFGVVKPSIKGLLFSELSLEGTRLLYVNYTLGKVTTEK